MTADIIDRVIGDLLAKICSHSAVNEAMQDAWSDICSDTGCHPLDIMHGIGRDLVFRPDHWADQIAKRLFVRALKLRLEVGAGVAQTVPSGWRLVPDRPTQRQMDAGLYQSSADSTWSDVYSIYADMIDAAPSIDDHPDDVNPVAAPPSNQGASK